MDKAGNRSYKKHNRQSIRLKGYDYSSPGAYFITLNVADRLHLLGRVEEGKVKLSPVGEIARKYWIEIPGHFPHVLLDEFVIMPDHIHGILIIKNDAVRVQDFGVQDLEPAQDLEPQQINRYQHIIPKSIGSIIRSFKAAVTHWCRQNGFINFRWQRNFHERIVRHEIALYRIRKYIRQNPVKWEMDRNKKK